MHAYNGLITFEMLNFLDAKFVIKNFLCHGLLIMFAFSICKNSAIVVLSNQMN